MSRRVKLPKINISNLSLFDEDPDGNLTFTKDDQTFMMKYLPSKQKFTWRPHQLGGGRANIFFDDETTSTTSISLENTYALSKSKDQKGGGGSIPDFQFSPKSSFKENLLFWMLLKKQTQTEPKNLTTENDVQYEQPIQRGGKLELQEACQQASKIVNQFEHQEFRAEQWDKLYESFQLIIRQIKQVPNLDKCNILSQIYNDLNNIYIQKKKKLMVQFRQKQQQTPDNQFNETQKFGYFFGIYKGNEYSKLTFYKTYKCLNGNTRITFYGHLDNEGDVIKMMDDDFIVRLCDQITSSISIPSPTKSPAVNMKNQLEKALLNYLDSFTKRENIKSKGSIVFYINDYVYFTSVNQNLVETKLLDPKAPIALGSPSSKGRIKSKGFHRNQIPSGKTYNIVLGSRGFWKVSRPGMIESVWGLMTGNSNFEELIGISDENERRRICQKLVKEATRQAPRDDVALIYTQLCNQKND